MNFFKALCVSLTLFMGSTNGENINPKVNNFKTIVVPNGTNPAASGANDALNFTSLDNSVTITGNSSTKTINFHSSGGAGSNPGGTNGQIQYNNLGSFGGDTATTDGSGNLSVASLTSSSVTASTLPGFNASKKLISSTVSSPLTYSSNALACQVASGSQAGCLASADFTTFNGKQAAGSYITALTSDVSASGPGSASATVNSIGGSSAANVHSAELAANAATSVNTVSTIVKRDSNGNFVSNNTVNVSTGNACSGTITLSAASSKIQVFSSGSGSCSVVLPDATTLAIGWEFELNNNASGVVTVKDNTASTLFTMTAGSYVKVITTSISFAAGQWDKHWLMPANASYGTSGLSVTGTITQSSLTASTALVADSSKNISSSSVTSTELGYVSGVTSGIQSQINGKQATGNYITALTGDVTASGPGSVAATLTNASVTGQALTGFSSGSGTVTASDTILTAFNKVYGWIVKIWVDEINGQVETVANKTYVLVDKARYARTVDKINIVCNTSGTVTVNLKIGSTSITSCSAISVTSTPGDTTCTAANAMVAGDQLTMVTTSNSACLDLAFTVQTTRN